MKKNTVRVGKNTLIGMVWMFCATGVGKLASLITQVVLGWLLTKEDFGLYALALSVSASVSLLRNGGTQQILIQKGEQYDALAPGIFKFSLVFNCLACLILLLISPLAVKVYQAPELQLMLGLIAVSIILMTPSGVLRAKLVIDHRFKEISIINLISNITRQGSTMICALMGLGYMSFIWPVLLEPIMLFCLSLFFVRTWVKGKKLSIHEFKQIFVDARWVMLGSLAIALSSTGQYFAVGLFADKESLGVYFFGFQLIIVVSVIITNVLETVFLPVLTSLSNNQKQYQSAYINVLFSICFISLIISVLGFTNAEWLINLVWNGKWDQAIPIVELLILTLPAILFTNFNKVVMESKGLWGKRLINLGFYVVGDITIAGIAAWKYDIYYAALIVCIYRNFFALLQCIWMAYVVDVKMTRILHSITPNLLLVLGLSISSVLIIQNVNNNYVGGDLKPVLMSIIIVLLFLLFNFIFENKRIKIFMRFVK